MTSAKTEIARIGSENAASLKWPYKDTYARLYVRQASKAPVEVFFAVETGQLMCGYRDCHVTIRINEEKAYRVPADRPSDHSSVVLFLGNEAKIVRDLKKAKVIRVQVEFFQNGSHVYEFRPDAALVWGETPKKR